MIQRHPIESFSKTKNFWEEFPDYKVHRTFGAIWSLNKQKDNLKNSSLFMWALVLCYDRKSAMFPQPESDKWEVVGEDLWEDPQALFTLAEDPLKSDIVYLPKDVTLFQVIQDFESSIDTPLGISLRTLEKKLAERTKFIKDTPYTVDEYKTINKRQQLVKGTASQLDKMFADTDKITALIQKAMDNLRSSQVESVSKGGQKPSLGDGSDDF